MPLLRTLLSLLSLSSHYTDDHGAIFACSRDEGEKRASTIYYRPFQTWGSSAEWSASLPDDDDAVVVATGSEWSAVATLKGFVHVFSWTGVEKACFSVPGPVVSMNGRGNQLAVVYHEAAPQMGKLLRAPC